jgi:hypothetical protein
MQHASAVNKNGHPKTMTVSQPRHGCSLALNPKNEIGNGHLLQSLGRKRVGKIKRDRCGYGFDFSNVFALQHLATSGHFLFRFSG